MRIHAMTRVWQNSVIYAASISFSS